MSDHHHNAGHNNPGNLRFPVTRSGLVIAAVSTAAAAALATAIGLWSNTGHAQAPKGKGAPPAPKVLVTVAQAADVSEQRSFVGTVMPVRRSLVGSAAPGRVEEFLVNEGDAVQKGQPIAHLRRGIIQAELDAAKAELAVRQAELGELENSLQDEIDQVNARLENASAQLAYRQGKVERSRSLGTAVAREIVEEDTSFAVQAAAAVREAKAALRLLTGPARQQKTKQAMARVEAQAAEVQRLTEQFERHTMFAPFDGYISAEHTEVGHWVMQGDPVAEVLELNQVDVEIQVLEDYVAQLNTSTIATVELHALPGQTFQGRVAIINPQADARSRTFPVKIRIDNQLVDGLPQLKSGMFARVALPVGQPTPRILVPKDAVVLGGQSPVVYLAETSGGKTAVRPVPVKLGPAMGTWIAIEGAVKAGDTIVVEGNERVRPGQDVRIETKEMAFPS